MMFVAKAGGCPASSFKDLALFDTVPLSHALSLELFVEAIVKPS
jgi:hypothetical protein